MKFPLSQLLLSAAIVLCVPAALAQKADRNKPINIESDAMRYDDLKQVSIFTGRVILTKGTLIIRAPRIEMRQDPEGYQFGVATGEPGTQAFFRQQRDGSNEFVEGEADTLEYDGRADMLHLIKNAKLRRLRGSALNDEVTGAVIHYNNVTDLFTVEGVTSRGEGGGRVRVMLTPKPEAAPRAAVPVPPESVELRATPALGKERK